LQRHQNLTPLALLFLALLAFCRPATATPADLPVEQYTLPNGLTVILAPMPAAQRVAIVAGYRVGSADEPPGRSGFAHLFEHLMFEGTNAIPEYDAVVSSLGAETNAFTEWDATTYYAVGQPKNLPKLLRLEADRMANLANAVTQDDLDNQRDIVKNEMRQNTLDQPGASARLQALANLAGPDHPYGHATIGSVADLDAATLADVQAFHRTYYVPSNAIVAIAGRFDMAVARQLVGQTFGLVPKGTHPAAAEGTMKLAASQRLEFKDAVEAPTLIQLWSGPRDNTREDVAAMVAGMVLGSDAGPVYAKLVHRDGLATAAGATWDSRRLGGTFMLYARAAKDVSPEKLEAGLAGVMKEIGAEGLSKEQMQAAIASIEGYLDSAVADPLSYALLLQGMAASTGTATDWLNYIAEASSITADEALAELRRITSGPGVAAIITPGPRNANLPPVVAQSTGSAEPLVAAARDDVVIPDLPELSFEAAAFPTPQSFTLSNGLAVNLYATGDTTTTAFALIVPHGTTVTNGPKKGLAELATEIRSRGAGTMTMSQFSLELDKIGARLSASTSDHATVITAGVSARNFAKAAEFLALAITSPRFDAREWQTQVEQRAQYIEQRLKDPSIVANRALAKASFPEGAAEGELSNPANVRAFAMADAEAVFRGILDPNSARLEVVTATPFEDVRKTFEAALGGWTKSGESLVSPPAKAPRFAAREITEHVAGATQTAIVMQFAAPEPFTPEALASAVAMQVLGGSSSGRLYGALREEKGWSYGIYGGNTDGEKGLGDASGYISTSVQADRTTDSLAEIRRVLAEVKARPITEAEFNGALQEIRNQYAAVLETADGLLSTIAWSVSARFELSDVAKKLALYDAVTLAQVQAEAEAIASRSMITVIAGDRDTMK
jgi:predicted Zn-dependent peptidase